MFEAVLTLPSGEELIAARICTDADALIMGHIRNRCAAGFSHDTGQISDDAQLAWWNSDGLYKEAWLYLTGRGLHPVGYGLLRETTPDGKDGFDLVSSVAVLPEYGGRGFGKAITAHLIRSIKLYTDAGDNITASARLDNPAAMALHRAEDWRETGRDDRLVYYRVFDSVANGGQSCDLYEYTDVRTLGAEEFRRRFSGWIGAVFARMAGA